MLVGDGSGGLKDALQRATTAPVDVRAAVEVGVPPTSTVPVRTMPAPRGTGRRTLPRRQRPPREQLPPVAGRAAWERRYVAAVLGLDVLAIVIATVVAGLVRIEAGPVLRPGRLLVVLVALCVAWVGAIAVARGYESRFIGVGSEEFKRVANAAVGLIALIATVSYAGQSQLGRREVVVALPLATALALLFRYAARKVLVRRRIQGRCMNRVVVVGTAPGVADLVATVRRAPHAGMAIVGCCLDPLSAATTEDVSGIPVLGDITDVLGGIRLAAANTVAVTSRGAFTPGELRRLSWQLEGTGVDMLVAPAIADIAGPRIHIRPVASLPLLHVEEPELSGGRRLLKGTMDRLSAAFMLLLLLPSLLLIGLLIRLDSSGPVLFRQTRVGKGGREFTMLKFRSMRRDAEAVLAQLQADNETDGLLFKMKHDPRITRVGHYLRKFSLDELPQLINVLKGDMSLVGPRPPLPSEVARYETDVHRRLLVKPGLTGLWQVSGRSDLSWEESVRLDLEYVENWSLALDAMILWKTAAAVMRSSGAY